MMKYLLIPAVVLATKELNEARRMVQNEQCGNNNNAQKDDEVDGRSKVAAVASTDKTGCYCGDTSSFDGEEVFCYKGDYCIQNDVSNGGNLGDYVEANCVEHPICENTWGEHETPKKCTCYEYGTNAMLTCENGETCIAKNGELECKHEDYFKMSMGNLRTLPRSMHGNMNVLTCGFVENHYVFGSNYNNNGFNNQKYATACSDPKHWKYSKNLETRSLDIRVAQTGRVGKFQSHYDSNCCKTLGPNALAGIIVAAVIVFLALLIVLGCCRKTTAVETDDE